ncbi:MAG: hypothetical protein HQM08_22970 [Candidatus Riflebacteria bacterium]|nr:hypothetical protein [Candidatus Riflebacteria bacterium]
MLDFLVALLLAAIVFYFWPISQILDDGGIILKYMDNFREGYFYSYNPADGPIFGISGFLHGIISGAFAWTKCFSPLNSLFASNYIGSVILVFSTIQVLRGYSENLIVPWVGSIWAIGFASDLILNLRQGLETPLHVGILLTLFVFLKNRNFKFLSLFGALAIVSKIDAIPVFGICIILFLIREYLETGEMNLSEKVKILAKWASPILVVWTTFCCLVFGSPLPQTAYAKLFFHPHPTGSWFPFLKHLSNYWDTFLLLLFLVSVYIFFSSRERKFPKAENFFLILSCLAYLVLYCIYNPHEQMSWYYAFPEVLLNLQILVLIFRILDEFFEKHRFILSLVSVFLLIAFQIPFLSTEIFSAKYLIENSVSELISIGKWIKSNSNPDEKLLTGHGFIARESGLYCIDYSGLNSKIATRQKLNLEKIVQEVHPDWMTYLGLIPRNVQMAECYELVKSGYEVSQFGGQPYRVYHKKPGFKTVTVSYPGNLLSCKEEIQQNQEGMILCSTANLEFKDLSTAAKTASLEVSQSYSISFGVERQVGKVLLSVEILGRDEKTLNREEIQVSNLTEENQILERMQECRILLDSQQEVDKLRISARNANNEPVAINLLGPVISLQIKNN